MDLYVWLDQLCQMMPGIQRAICLTDFSEKREACFHWPNDSLDDDDLVSAAKLAKKQQQTVTSTSSKIQNSTSNGETVIAYPLTVNNELFAIVALRISIKPAQQNVVMQLLHWGEGWLQVLTKTKIEESYAPIINVLLSAVAYDSRNAQLQSVSTSLANELNCDRVVIGMLSGEKIQVNAISNNTRFDPKVALIQYIELAMAETYQQQKKIIINLEQNDNKNNVAAHDQLAKKENDLHLCTIPIGIADNLTGVILLERKNDRPFKPEEIKICEIFSQILSAILFNKPSQKKINNVVGLKFIDPFLNLFNKNSSIVKTGMVSIFLFLVLILFMPGEYRVKAPGIIEGKIQRVIVAPYEGYIESAVFRSGEIVSQGDVIAEMDTKSLQLEQQRWQGQKSEYMKQYRGALSELNKAKIHIYKSQISQADAQLKLINKKIQRAKLVSPLDGIIIAGDLSRSLGAPVKRGEILFQVAPLNEYRIIIMVEEREIVNVKEGLTGQLVLKALPDNELEFIVKKVSPVFEEKLGEINYRVEAVLNKDNPVLRPGMQGVAKITIEERSLAWIYFHKLFDAIKLFFWSWLP